MKTRACPAFIHGFGAAVALFYLAEYVLGLESLASPFPPWFTVPMSLLALIFTWVDLRRNPEEVTIVRTIWRCRKCELDYEDSEWVCDRDLDD